MNIVYHLNSFRELNTNIKSCDSLGQMNIERKKKDNLDLDKVHKDVMKRANEKVVDSGIEVRNLYFHSLYPHPGVSGYGCHTDHAAVFYPRIHD